MAEPLRSREGVCDVAWWRGDAAAADGEPDLVLEVAHGATRAAEFDRLRAQLRGSYDDGLRDFFFVNTDVGAPELATATARGLVAAMPQLTAVVVRCLLPRTFVDCNRRIDRDAIPKASAAGEMTPGLPPWVREAADRTLLLERYFAYREVVERAVTSLSPRGLTLFVHSYAPRSIDVAVDDNIGRSLRAAYASERIASWPLRPPIDLITHDPDGRLLAASELAERAAAAWQAAGFEVARNASYALHPITLAHSFATQRPDRTMCFEVRRDLLLPEFVPFVELFPDAAAVQRVAAPLVAALSETLKLTRS